MKKTLKKMMALMIMAAVIMTSAVPTLAAFQYDKNITEYFLDSSSILGPSGERIIVMHGMPGKISNVKSSNKSVVKILSYSNYDNKYNYFHSSPTALKNSKDSYITYQAKKPGSSTISFKVGSKTYKSKIKVLKYVNPLSSLTLTGINDGKSFHEEFNKKTSIGLKVKKSVSNAKITVKAKKGWVITSLRVSEQSHQYYDDDYKSARSSMSLKHIRLRKGNGTSDYYTSIGIELMNKSNGGKIYLSLDLN